jgi:hypothetical protein
VPKIISPEKEGEMKIRWTSVIGGVGLVLAAGQIGSAAEQEPLRPARVTWLRPDRVPVRQRRALTRLLAATAAGQPLSGVRVRDSRPQIDGEWAAGLGCTEPEVRVGPAEIGDVYTRHHRGNKNLLRRLSEAP